MALWLAERGDTLAAYVHCLSGGGYRPAGHPASLQLEAQSTPLGLPRKPALHACVPGAGSPPDGPGAWDNAILILGRLLAVNPNDNQGVRYELPQCWFETGDAAAVIAHCCTHRNDTSPFIHIRTPSR